MPMFHLLRRAAQRGHIACHKAALHLRRVVTKRHGDDFRTDACTVALGDGDRQGRGVFLHKNWLKYLPSKH